MTSSLAVSTETWVTAESHCRVTCDVVGDQAQFQFGTLAGALHLVLDETVLATLARVASGAHNRLQAIPEGEEVSFTVTPNGDWQPHRE